MRSTFGSNQAQMTHSKPKNKNILEPQSFEDSLWICSVSYGIAKKTWSPIAYKALFLTSDINTSCQKDWHDYINRRESIPWIDFVTNRSSVKKFIDN